MGGEDPARDAAQQIVLTNGHAPEQFRAQTVRNLDAWYPAFNVQPGQKLYLAPDKRVKIWGTSSLSPPAGAGTTPP